MKETNVSGRQKLKKSSQAVWDYLQTHAVNDEYTATQSQIAKGANISNRSVRYALEQLQELEYLTVTVGKENGTANIYHLLKNDVPKTDVLFENVTHETDVLDKDEKVSVSGKTPNHISLALDKVSQTMFRNKSASYITNVARECDERADIMVKMDFQVIDFEKLSEDKRLKFKKLTPYDEHVYTAIQALLDVGNEYISASQISIAMGCSSRPAPNQIENIIDSCEKMLMLPIYISNHEEIALNYHYPEFEIRCQLLPADRMKQKSVTINGKNVDYCLHLLKSELPLFTFARGRKQVGRCTLEQWAMPLPMTESNLLLTHYFLRRILQMQNVASNEKKQKGWNKMLFTTIYEKCELQTKAQKNRVKKKYQELLEHYKKTGFIQEYNELEDGIQIILPPQD